MELSKRLKSIIDLADHCHKIVDVGTDHGYVPIFMVQNSICSFAVASDINKGPVEKARINVSMEGLSNKIDCRKGPGLSTIKKGEADAAIIAGMGGNLIRDIIEEDISIVKTLKYMILQPVQNPEVIRKYLYHKGFYIIDEELCYEEGIFYEIIKAKYGSKPKEDIEEIYYEISPILIEKKHPLLKDYLNYKINRYKNIYNNITEMTPGALTRKNQVSYYIIKLEEMLKCL